MAIIKKIASQLAFGLPVFIIAVLLVILTNSGFLIAWIDTIQSDIIKAIIAVVVLLLYVVISIRVAYIVWYF